MRLCEKWVAEGRKEGMKDGILEGRKEGITIGEENKAKEIAFSLANKGMNAEYIADVIKMNIAVVRQWLEGVPVSR